MPAKMLALTCSTCGDPILRLASQHRGKKNAYCSNECRYESRRNGKWTPSFKITDKQAINDLVELKDALGRIPTIQDVHDKWPHRQLIYFRRFGSFGGALLAAGIKPPPIIINGERVQVSPNTPIPPHKKGQTKYTNDELIEELKRVANAIGHTPTDQEFRKHGNCSVSNFWRQFGSWVKACKLAGLRPHTTSEGGPARVPFFSHIRPDSSTVRLQGSYEKRLAIKLDALKIPWLIHGEFDRLSWVDKKGVNHRYMPDFYLVEQSLYIEVKGWFQARDQEKMRCVIAQNPDKTIVIIQKDDLAHFEATSELPDHRRVI